MALWYLGSVIASWWSTPSWLHLPSRMRLGHGTSTMPAPDGGDWSSPKGGTRSMPLMLRVRMPAATAVIVAWTSPLAVDVSRTNCSPVGTLIPPL